MRIKKLLSLMDDDHLLHHLTEGAVVVKELRKAGLEVEFDETLTAAKAMTLISTLPPEEAHKVLGVELNENVSFEQYKSQLNLLREHDQGKSELTQKVLVFGMATLTAILTIAYSIGMLWKCYHDKTLPSWSDLAMFLIVPGMVIWHYAGVSYREKRDLMELVMGNKLTDNVTETIKKKFTKNKEG